MTNPHECDFFSCKEAAIDDVGGIHFCALHEEWAMQVLDDSEYADHEDC